MTTTTVCAPPFPLEAYLDDLLARTNTMDKGRLRAALLPEVERRYREEADGVMDASKEADDLRDELARAAAGDALTAFLVSNSRRKKSPFAPGESSAQRQARERGAPRCPVRSGPVAAMDLSAHQEAMQAEYNRTKEDKLGHPLGAKSKEEAVFDQRVGGAALPDMMRANGK